MNLAAAYDQLLSGTTDIAGASSGNLGLVDEIGWDSGQVVSGTTNDYFFNSPLDGGSTFTATLSWFRDRGINASNAVFDDSYDDLNLELWSVVEGAPASLISESSSLYNESEHFSFTLPVTGDYALRVRWFKEVFDRVADANQEKYGLAWWAGAGLQSLTIPEPASILLLAMALGASRHALRTRRHSSDRRVLQIAAATIPLVAFASAARADIFRWEYINPAVPSQGKQQSTTLAPDGAGVDAVPGANLSGRNLTMAYLIGADLTGATLTDADFADAEIQGAALSRVITSTGPRGTGVTLAQLYSTASYQGHDLTGINLSQTNVAGGDFTGQNLTNANFDMAWLVGADFSGAEVRGANFGVIHRGLGGVWLGSGITIAQLYSTASYQAKDLSGVHLDNNVLNGANFAGHNLTNAAFTGTWLNDADFTGAEIRGASFARGDSGTGISGSQLYSTASYQAKDSRGVRGLSGLSLPGPFTTTLILPSGHISGLHLESDGLVIRDYDGNARYSSTPPIPMTIDQYFVMAPSGTLRMVIEADAWDSTISFAPGIPVTLGGTLELTFAEDVNLATQLGRTFDLFDWTGVTPTGAFAISGPYAWDLSNLYTTGEVTLTTAPEPATPMLVIVAVVGIRRLSNRMRRELVSARDRSTIDPFDDTVKLCRKLISAPRLTHGSRSGGRNTPANQGIWHS